MGKKNWSYLGFLYVAVSLCSATQLTMKDSTAFNSAHAILHLVLLDGKWTMFREHVAVIPTERGQGCAGKCVMRGKDHKQLVKYYIINDKPSKYCEP